MKKLLGLVGAVVVVVGCGAAGSGSAPEDALESLATEHEVSATATENDDGSCPSPDKCPVSCGDKGDKVLICHHAPPDKKGSKSIELCIDWHGAEAHLREHSKDKPGYCKDKP
jgi:hypothetical protein